jgi:hypothetical protein
LRRVRRYVMRDVKRDLPATLGPGMSARGDNVTSHKKPFSIFSNERQLHMMGTLVEWEAYRDIAPAEHHILPLNLLAFPRLFALARQLELRGQRQIDTA